MVGNRRTEFFRIYWPEEGYCHLATGAAVPLCHARVEGDDWAWFGTGSQDEYDFAEMLPVCADCIRIAGSYGIYDEMNPQLEGGDT